jgi:hypothetical protein
MEKYTKTMKRSSTLVLPRNQLDPNKKLPNFIQRYQTRFSIDSSSEKLNLITPVYVPAPKPSKLLLDFLSSPSSSKKETSGWKSGNFLQKKTLLPYIMSGNKTPNLEYQKNNFQSPGMSRRLKIFS